MFTVDNYLPKVHNMEDYNCWDFIREVWLELTDEDIGFRTPKNVTRKAMKEKFAREEADFTQIDTPIDPCIVLFKRHRVLPHVGIFVRGKVLHLPEHSHAKYEKLEIASLGFKEVGFYLCKQSS